MNNYFGRIFLLLFITTSLSANPFCELFQNFKKNRLHKKSIINNEAVFLKNIKESKHNEIYEKYLIDEELVSNKALTKEAKYRQKTWKSGMKVYKEKVRLAIAEEERIFLKSLEEFGEKGELKNFLNTLHSDDSSDLLSPHYKKFKKIARRNSLRKKNYLTKKAIDNYEREFSLSLKDMDMDQKLDLFWSQKETSFSFLEKGHELYGRTSKARIHTWMLALDRMSPTDYMKRFWEEFKSADGVLRKMKRVIISKHAPNPLVRESLGGLLVGRDPTAVASGGNFLLFPFRAKNEVNFFLTGKILRRPGSKVDLQNVFRKVTERVLLKERESFHVYN